MTGGSLADVLQKTPAAGVVKRKRPAEVKKENRDRLRGDKHAIEGELRKRDHDLLFQNRLSFRKYKKIRLGEAFESSEEAANRTKSQSPSSRTHGSSPDNLGFDTDALLEEAKSWSDDQQVNWTELAKRYGVIGSNCGQVVKEFLHSQAIPAAMTKRHITRRAKLRLPGGEVTYPTHMTIADQKHTLLQKIREGDILIGELIAPIVLKKFVVNKSTKTISEAEITIHGRQISLNEIRSKLLREHKALGIARISHQPAESELSDGELNEALHARHIEFDTNASTIEKKQILLACQKRRYLKVWHDHGPIAGRSHFMVLVTCLYDPAFFIRNKN